MPYYLDNQPPFVSLQPPDVRLVTPAPNNQHYCSAPFDPLGPKMPENGEIVASFAFYRAFVWDRTNGKDSQSIFYYAGVDPSSVQLFVQTDNKKGIVYDKSGDGDCDSIDDAVMLLSGQPYLDPITERGTPINDPPSFQKPAPDVSNVSGETCASQSNTLTYLCTDQVSDMNVVVHQEYAGQSANDAAVYGYSVATNSVRCTGLDWDISKFAKPGWVCLAAMAKDDVGNVGISAPIAVCFYDGQSTKPSCATDDAGTISNETPPSCIEYDKKLDSAQTANLAANLQGLGGYCRTPSKSLAGDWSATANAYVPYDIGNPVPFYIQYRQ